MRNASYWARITIVAALGASGCRSGATAPSHELTVKAATTQPVIGASSAVSPNELDSLIGKQGTVTFRSSGGRRLGFDGDYDLMLARAGKLLMIEYGLGGTIFEGTYSIDRSGIVVVTVPSCGHNWPKMTLERDATSLLLSPIISPHDAATGPTDGYPWTSWPFRPLKLDEEVELRKELKAAKNE